MKLYVLQQGQSEPDTLPETIVISMPKDNHSQHPNITNEVWLGEWEDVEYDTEGLSDEFLAATTKYKLVPEKPAITAFEDVEWNGHEWVITESEAAKLTRAKEWISIRKIRNDSLAQTDITVQQFIDNAEEIPQEWIDYRIELRDLPQVYETGEIDDWTLVSWPVSPHQQTYDENGGTGE